MSTLERTVSYVVLAMLVACVFIEALLGNWLATLAWFVAVVNAASSLYYRSVLCKVQTRYDELRDSLQ